MPVDPEYQELLEKYKKRIKEELGQEVKVTPSVVSREYQQFKKEIYPKRYSLYEKACNFSGKLLKLKVDPKKATKLQENIDLCHLQITPSGVISFSILAPLLLMLFGSLIFFGIFQMVFFVVFFLFAGLVLIMPLQKLPIFIGNSWRMKSSNQMVQCIFYLVTYMKHTSNLERAIEFASNHLTPPLSLDMKKVLWNVETGKHSSIKDSLEEYLLHWSKWDKEFVEAVHLIESSLYAGSEDRRLALLDKSLDVILTGTYEKMLHYAHNLKSPMTMLHMLGIILPILGLVILPLVVSFMGGEDSSPIRMAVYIAMLYNVTLPITVYYLGKIILSKRPTGYGETDISEQNPELKKYKNVLIPLGKKFKIKINPLFFSVALLAVLLLVGFSPLILHTLNPGLEIPLGENFKMLGYICPTNDVNCADVDKVGPYGLGASLLSLVAIIGIGLSLGLYFKLRSKNVFKIRQETKKLEGEFASALFQLGNRLGDGLPAEIAFAKVAQTMEGTTSGNFFNLIEKNITKLGMGVKEAIFDSKVGALVYFPSKVIESSMKVLIESVKKGPKIAAQALLSMSRYIKEIHRVNERLKDLMADTISSMKSQIKFLTPAIAGIVIGITSMITSILTNLSAQLQTFSGGEQSGMAAGGMLEIFGIGLPTFHFQLIVGLYVVQIVYILTVLASGIENGADKLGENYSLGKNLVGSTLLYCILAGVVMLLFNFFAQTVMTSTLGT
ncbi:hypothetical protein GOV03_00210 [Candidatus Woesearchaeota archaeon]|nr:hypothetical protein [Candidatus Woesearchaeota archaeon]